MPQGGASPTANVALADDKKRMGWTHMTFEDEIQSSVSLLTKAIEIVLQCNFFERS
jgi:hypothetical protein